MTISLADVMSNLQDPERTLATVRQWASERVSDCHESLVVLDALDQAFRCWQCGRECEPVLPVEKETTVPDDTEGVRKMAEDWWIWVCPECNGLVGERSQAHNETCPNRRRLRMFVPRAVEVVPLERAEKAERERDELRDQLDGMVSADWHGLTAILDTLYPADVFTGESGDPGARIVVLARELVEVTQRAEKAEAAARELSQALIDVAMLLRAIDIHAPESRAWAALARHPEYAPKRKETP